jgi:uncharacterized SAM-binding protein YcdF (DUF218 family)
MKNWLRGALWRWRWRLGIAAVLVVLFFVRAGWLPSVALFLDVSEAPVHSDYVMVLGGGANSRPFAAAALIRAHLADKVLVPRVGLTPEQEAGVLLPEHETTIRVLRARGVPEGDIELLPGEVASTGDEARALATFLRDHPGATVTVVTHGFHTRRARMIISRALGGTRPDIHFYGIPTDHFDTSNWWLSEGGAGCYFNEYVKLGLYSVGYGSTGS